MQSNGIKGKVVVITGASSGIGEATALLLAEKGAKVVLGARRVDTLESLRKRIVSIGGQVAYLATDVCKRTDVEQLIAYTQKTFGNLDVVVNSAGVAQLSYMEEIDVEGWEEMIDVNLKGTLYSIAAAIPLFQKQGFGHFVNIISTAGMQITPTMGVYAGTKNAVRTISETMRKESGGRWRVTGISPGFVKTPFADSIRNEAMRHAIQQQAAEIAIPPSAIAESVAYAISQPENVEVGDIVVRPSVQD